MYRIDSVIEMVFTEYRNEKDIFRAAMETEVETLKIIELLQKKFVQSTVTYVRARVQPHGLEIKNYYRKRADLLKALHKKGSGNGDRISFAELLQSYPRAVINQLAISMQLSFNGSLVGPREYSLDKAVTIAGTRQKKEAVMMANLVIIDAAKRCNMFNFNTDKLPVELSIVVKEPVKDLLEKIFVLKP